MPGLREGVPDSGGNISLDVHHKTKRQIGLSVQLGMCEKDGGESG